MDWDSKTISDWLQWGFMAVISLVVWLRKPGEQHALQISQIDGRLIAIEAKMKHMPSKEELADLKGSVSTIDERTRGLADSISTVRASQNRIETFLLQNK